MDHIDTLQMKTTDDQTGLPALTTLLYRVCDGDSMKFVEACRLLRLFMEASKDVGLAREADLSEWKFCPECGSEDLHHQEGTHKQCGHCYQEYWSDSDYTDVVRGHLAKLQPLQHRLAEAEKLLRLFRRNLNGGGDHLRGMEHGEAFRAVSAFLASPGYTGQEKKQ